MSEVLKESVIQLFPSAVSEEGSMLPTWKIPEGEWKREQIAKLKSEPFLLDYLFFVSCIDWKTHFTIVYYFSSTTTHENLVIKTDLSDRTRPMIQSVSEIWRTAEFHEREVYDLFGIYFKEHPDLRRLFLTEEWKGFPLRKDYEDPVNMIKL